MGTPRGQLDDNTRLPSCTTYDDCNTYTDQFVQNAGDDQRPLPGRGNLTRLAYRGR
jgi:hypothetical protein